jgi:hypothetical protein
MWRLGRSELARNSGHFTFYSGKSKTVRLPLLGSSLPVDRLLLFLTLRIHRNLWVCCTMLYLFRCCNSRNFFGTHFIPINYIVSNFLNPDELRWVFYHVASDIGWCSPSGLLLRSPRGTPSRRTSPGAGGMSEDSTSSDLIKSDVLLMHVQMWGCVCATILNSTDMFGELVNYLYSIY